MNRPGFGHRAFGVDNVKEAREGVLAGGGKAVGDIVAMELSIGAKVI
ncbi:MAG: hypothetical protein WBZ48_14295 [Bacteroidota bacterium]